MSRGWILCCLLCLLWAGSGGCQQQDEAGKRRESGELPTLEAEVLTIAPQRWPTTIRSQGNLVADDTAVVGTRVEGLVKEVHVDLGQRVEAGEPLATLRQDQFELEVTQAEAALLEARSAVGLKDDQPVDTLNEENAPVVVEMKALLKEADSNLERAKRLQERNAITPAEFAQIEAAQQVATARVAAARNGAREKIALVKVRQAELDLAAKQLEDSVIQAPFAGYVEARLVSAGTYVRVGDPIARLVQTDPLRFHGTIPERYALDLSVGQRLELRVQSVHSPLTVTVVRVSPALDLASRALAFEAEVDNHDGRLRAGLFAEARIEINSEAEALVIPPSALVEFAGVEKVWKVVDGTAKEQPVLTGERREQGIEILQGLAEGDVILVDGARGQPAKIKPTAVGLRDPEAETTSPARQEPTEALSE